MARRRKESRKYKPMNEFRRNNSPLARGHFNFVFGETKDHYKSLGLTSSPRENIKHVKLHKNPNPQSDSASYLQLKVLSTQKRYFIKEPEEGWAFAKEDMPVVRHTIKKYKKATNKNQRIGMYLRRNIKIKTIKKIDELRKQFV